MWRYLLALPFVVHGLAHVSGFLASWTALDVGYRKNRWIFSSNVFLDSPVGRVFGLLWLAAGIGLAGSGYAIVFRHGWWWQLAISASALSLVVIVTWWNSVPPGAKAGAVFNLLLIVFLLSPLRHRLLEIIG